MDRQYILCRELGGRAKGIEKIAEIEEVNYFVLMVQDSIVSEEKSKYDHRRDKQAAIKYEWHNFIT